MDLDNSIPNNPILTQDIADVNGVFPVFSNQFSVISCLSATEYWLLLFH